MSDHDEKRDVERVRDLLREKGYLDSPLEQYLIPGVSGGGSFLAWDLLLATKVGAVAGAFFSILLGLQAIAENPELAAHPADLVVWMAYLFPITAVPIASLDALLGVALRTMPGRWRTRPDLLARITGALMGSALLGFLALFWLSEPFPPHGSPAQGVASIVLLATLIVLVARLLSLSVLGFALRLGAVPRAMEKSARRRWIALLPFLALASLWIASGAWDPARTDPRPPADFSVQPPGYPVTLVGIDGLSFEEARGLPAIADLLAKGWAARLSSAPMVGWNNPAAIWTTMSTGQPPEKHGITSLEILRMPGMSTGVRESDRGLPGLVARAVNVVRIARPEPIRDTARTAKAVWEILSDKGQAAIVVNFWGTSPAQELPKGVVVSETTFFTLRRGQKLTREASPTWVADLALRQLAAAPAEGCDAAALRCFAERSDAFHAGLLTALQSHDAGLRDAHSLLYLPGRDVVRFLISDGKIPKSDLATFDGSLSRMVTDIADRACRGTLLLVASPGRAALPGATGLLLITGRAVRAGAQAEAVSLLDVAPTFLYFAGFPKSDDMQGQVLADAADDAFRGVYPLRPISTFGDRQRAPDPAAHDERDLYEDLKALGYVK